LIDVTRSLPVATGVCFTIALSMPPVRAQLDPRGSVTETITLSFDGRERQYLLHVPASADGTLVLAFHGGGLSGAQQRTFPDDTRSIARACSLLACRMAACS
jgi:poly(3-hydroxybutyrate) depolymerase